MDNTSQTFASPSLQADTRHPLPLRPINSEAKLCERSYRLITYGTELTEQENHAMPVPWILGRSPVGVEPTLDGPLREKCDL